MNRIIAASYNWLRSAGETVRASGYAAIAVVLLLFAVGGSSGQLTAQAPSACDQSKANSPESCNVLPLDAPIPVPSPSPPPWPRDLPVVEMGRLPDAKLRHPFAAQLQLPDGSSGEFAIIGNMPAGLQLDRERLLTGTPVAAGNFSLGLVVQGSKDHKDVVARWRLRVIGPSPIKPKHKPRQPQGHQAAADMMAPKEQQRSVSQSPPAPPGRIVVYRLTAKDLAKLDAELQANAAAQAQAVKAQTDKAEEQIKMEQQAQAMARALGMSQPPAPSPSPAPQTGTSKRSRDKLASTGSAAQTQPGQVANAAADARSAPMVLPAQPPLAVALKALSNVEFPTESLFQRAVVTRLGAVPSNLLKRIVQAARKPYAYSAVTPKMQWSDVGGWKAVRPIPSWGYRTIYGFMPFWWTPSEPPGASKAPAGAAPIIDFSLYDRIGILGAQLALDHDSAWIAGNGYFDWAGMSRFARIAQSHGTQLDLVLEASNWEGLEALPEVPGAGTDAEPIQLVFDQADLAANRAADLLNTKLNDPARYFRMALLPAWKVDSQVFSGLTVMFTPPARDNPKYQSFKMFTDRFVRTLIFRMKLTERPLTLNIAVSSEFLCNPKDATVIGEACNPGPYAFESIQNWQTTASLDGVLTKDGVLVKIDRPRKKGAAMPVGHKVRPLSFNLIVFIHQPTREARKRLRAAIDSIPNRAGFQGEQKVELLRSIIPVMFGPGDTSDLMSEDTVENQLAYYDEVFGGVGFWPVPMVNTPNGPNLNEQIRSEFFKPREVPGRSIIADESTRKYYMSTALRLLLEALALVLGALMIYLNFLGELAERTRVRVSRVTFVLAILTAVLFIALLYTDPALVQLAQGNMPLLVVGAVLVASIFVSIFKPKIIRP